jgi:HK97 family phage portal protein
MSLTIDLQAKFPFLSIQKSADAAGWRNISPWETTSGRIQPTDFKRQLEAFRGTVFASARLNAVAVAQVPLYLNVAKKSESQKFRFTRTAEIPQARLRYMYKQREFQRYRRKAAATEEVLDHPLLDLLDQVNPIQNGFDLSEKSILFLELTGNCFWHLIFNELGVPAEIWFISPEYMKPIPDAKLGVSGYVYKRGMKEIRFEEKEIIHFAIPSPLHELFGMGSVVGAWEAHRIWESMADYEIAHFENMGRPDMAVWLKHNLAKAEKERLENTLATTYVGAKKAGKIGVFSQEHIAEIQVLGEKLREMSYIEGRKYVREEIVAAHRVPISFLTMESSNRAVADAGLYQHALFTTKPYCTRMVQKLNEKLCPKFDEKIFLSYENPVPEDKEYRLKEKEAHLSTGVETVNEIRVEEMGKEPLPGFDVPWLPMNLMPAGSSSGAPMEDQIEEFWEKFFEKGEEKLRGFSENA